jgi:hypothetical protein
MKESTTYSENISHTAASELFPKKYMTYCNYINATFHTVPRNKTVWVLNEKFHAKEKLPMVMSAE